MKIAHLVKIVSTCSIYFLNANASEFMLPESHDKYLPELIKLAEEQEALWEEIQYNQDDPSTWVQAGLWPKIRGKVIGTLICPGVGTIIGHQVDLHDRREQDRQNAAKRDAYNQGVVAAEIERERLRQEHAEMELRHQQEISKMIELRIQAERDAAAKQVELEKVVEMLRQDLSVAMTTLPTTVKVLIESLAAVYESKILTATSLEEAKALFAEYRVDLQYHLERFGK